MSRLRRKPEAWLKSLEMDPKRKLLIVEGIEDRLFIEYLTDGKMDASAMILEINSIDISEKVEGGNKGRLLYLSDIIGINERFRIFIDKDYSEFIGVDFNDNIITTDFRDLESYLYEIDFLKKFIKIGLKTDKITENELLTSISLLRYFGVVRIVSLINEFNLSVNKTNEKLSKYISLNSDYSFSINEDQYITSLIQNSKNKIDFNTLSDLIKASVEKYASHHFKEIVHGKDMIELVKFLVSKLNFKKDNVENIFWMSFDSNRIEEYKNLSMIVDYVV